MSTIIDGSASVTINSGAILGITSGTAVASTSGTSIDFTSIPSWVKRITVMFVGVSLSGSDSFLFQLGAGSVTNTGYLLTSGYIQGSTANATQTSTSGFFLASANASALTHGHVVFTLSTGNTWVCSMNTAQTTSQLVMFGAGYVTLSGALDRVRLTTTGTNTFDAGSINILYE